MIVVVVIIIIIKWQQQQLILTGFLLCSECLIFISSLNKYNNPITIPISQMRKLRHRNVRQLAQGSHSY